jgi:hypothetical protein
MAFKNCGRPDPFTRTVREVYRANVLGSPRAGVEPLLGLAVIDRKVQPRGALSGLLADDGVPLPGPVTVPVVDLSGLRSASLDLKVGASLTAGFLAALGLPIPGADVSLTLLSGARSVDFEVRDVSECMVDLGAVGKALSGRTLADNPATKVFLTDSSVRLLFVSRVLRSRHFAVHTKGEAGQSAEVSVDAIEDLIGKAHGSVGWKRESADTLSFQGATDVSFAFAAVPCAVQADRTIVFGVETENLTWGKTPSKPEVKPVVEEDGLLDFDDGPDIS